MQQAKFDGPNQVWVADITYFVGGDKQLVRNSHAILADRDHGRENRGVVSVQ
jgi:transposase InsO family protein